MKSKAKIATMLLLLILPMLFSAVMIVPVSAMPEISVELDKPYYKIPETATVTIIDPGANVPEEIVGEIIGTGDGAETVFHARHVPIVEPYPTYAKRQDGVIHPFAELDPATGKVTLTSAPPHIYETKFGPTTVTALPLTASLTTPIKAPAQLLITVTDIAEVTDVPTDVTVSLTGKYIDPAAEWTEVTGTKDYVMPTASDGATVTVQTDEYWVSVDEAGITVSGTTGTDGFALEIEETYTVFLNYLGAVYNYIDFTVKSIKDSAVIDELIVPDLKETDLDTGEWTYSFTLVAEVLEADQLLAEDCCTIKVEYLGSDLVLYTATAGVDAEPPYVVDLFPEEGAYTDDIMTWVNATIVDDKAGIVEGTIGMTIEAIPVITVGSPVEGAYVEVIEEVEGTLLRVKVAFKPGGPAVFTAGLPETLIDVVVYVEDTVGNSETLGWSFTVDKTAPAKPTALTADALPYRVELSWAAPSFSGEVAPLDYYEVWRNVTSTPTVPEDFELIKTGITETSYTDYTGVEGLWYVYVVRAIDKAGNIGAFSDPAITGEPFYVGVPPTEAPIDLYPGWNLISPPLIPTNKTIDAVLSGMPNYMEIVEAVWMYDAETGNWYWFKPEVEASTLTEMVDGSGYWIKLTAPAELTIEGYVIEPGVVPPVYHVFPGWNLIGFKSTAPMDAEIYLANVVNKYFIVYGWTSATQTWKTVAFPADLEYYNMILGEGYWIYMTEEGDIVPPLP